VPEEKALNCGAAHNQGDHNAFHDSWNNRTRRLDGREHGVFVGCPGEFVCALQGRDPRQFGRSSALLVLVSIVFWTLPAMAVSRLTVSDTLRAGVTGDSAAPHPRAAFERRDDALRDLHA
jgi:hypothetical protein